MPRHFHVKYRWTYDDYCVLSRAQARLTSPRRFAEAMYYALVSVLLISAGAAVWEGQAGWLAYFLVLAAVLLILRFVVGPWHRRRSFAHQRLGEFDMDFEAGEEGFAIKSELSEGVQKWELIRRVDDFPQQVLLWPNNRMGWMVPKRAFATPEEAAAFVALAKEKTVGQTL